MVAVDLGLIGVVNLLLTLTVSEELKTSHLSEHIFVIKELREKID
jgi:hypothetical protein